MNEESYILKIHAFYPTYKELKLICHEFGHIILNPFYPTYKELKRASSNSMCSFSVTFYPTYKELKLCTKIANERPCALFILPIRN